MIRRGKLDDVAIIDPVDPFGGSREKEIAAERLHVFENEDGQPVGYISIAGYTFHGFPYITFLLVHPDYQRHGIASELLHHVEAVARSMDAATAYSHHFSKGNKSGTEQIDRHAEYAECDVEA